MKLRKAAIDIKHVARTVYCFQRQLWLLAWEVWVVFFYMKVFSAGELADDHPWVTGETEDGEPIWPRNIVYRSHSRLPEATTASDTEIVTAVGKFLRSMVSRSAVGPEVPQGPGRRMPHAVNYIHGSVHHNGAFLVFDDFADLVSHLTDRRFRRDLLRFGRRSNREVTLVFRNRKYDPLDFAYMVGCVRAHLPWFSNGNGPTKKPVLWGNMSPYPAIALINGAWMSDLWNLWRGRSRQIARPPVDSESHFRESYFGRRSHFTFTDRLLAWYMFTDVRARGFRGQIFFSDRRRIEPQRVEEYREAGGYWSWVACHEVPPPRIAPASRRSPLPRDYRVSVVIPTLNEAEEIESCVSSVRRSLNPAEIIVADGGSADATVRRARDAGARVVLDRDGGRGGQCRTGAEVATGEILVFLHADCRPRAGARRAIERSFEDRGRRIAMFRQRSSLRRKRYRFLDWLTSFDSMFTRFGDQGIIVRRDFYEELGGMPDTRLFEDVEFLRRARRRGPIRRVDAVLEVSPRRFERRGVARQLATDTWLVGRYLMGASPSRLWEHYHGAEVS